MFFSQKLIFFSASGWVNGHLPDGPAPSSLCRWFHLTRRRWSPVWGQGDRGVLFSKTASQGQQREAEEAACSLSSCFREGWKWQCKNAQERRGRNGCKCVFVCHVKMSTDVREAGQSYLPVSLKMFAKQEALHYIIPPLNHRVSNVNAH